jgi:hypothetical protein
VKELSESQNEEQKADLASVYCHELPKISHRTLTKVSRKTLVRRVLLPPPPGRFVISSVVNPLLGGPVTVASISGNVSVAWLLPCQSVFTY